MKSVSDINKTDEEVSYCPSCREVVQETSRSKFVERQVLKLKVKCANCNDGCEWKGELKYFKQHLGEKCQFTTISCKYCQQIKYQRGKEEEHLLQCEEFPIECKLCSEKIARKSYDIHKEKLCPNLLISCPNKCSLEITQSSLKMHVENQCENRRIDCLYSCYGCQERPKYIDLKLHLSQHQVVHLELKILYLERLSISTELLSISNTTGIYPEISGLYEREQKPYFARPVWKSKNKDGKYKIRYDNTLNSWVLDKKGFEGEIVALRYGKYPTPVAKVEDPQHVLQLESMLINDNDHAIIDNKAQDRNGEDAIIAINNNNNEEEKDDEKKMEDKPKAKRKKRGLFCDGLWHIKGNVENSRIKVQGFTEKEFDLDWELKSLSAQMRRHRSGIQQVSMINQNSKNNNNNMNDLGNGKPIINEQIRRNYVVSCICGKGMMKISHNPYGKLNQSVNNFSAICDICGSKIMQNIEFFHCPAKGVTTHIGGYDLCLSCSEARQQTQNLNTPSCECGNKMVAIMSFNAYKEVNGVSCNICGGRVDGAIWHCTKKYTKAHESGFDLCINCGKNYAPKSKSGIMGWLTSRQ